MFVRHMARRQHLPDFVNIALVLFMTIWACHFVLVNLFARLGPTHLLTYGKVSTVSGGDGRGGKPCRVVP